MKVPKKEVHDLRGLKCYAYGASRRMAESGVMEDEHDDPTASLFADGVPLPNAEEWLLQADYAAKRAEGGEQKKAERRRDRVIDLLVDLLPDVEAIRYAEPEEPRLVPRVEFETPYGWVTLDRLGLGYRTMIAWTVDVARRLFGRYPNSPNPLAEPAVVLVDEIDLHLHPTWQRSIIEFLSDRFPNTQFIVTAHSLLIVQSALDANIAVLRRPEGSDHVVIEQDLQLIPNLRVDQILTSELYGMESARPKRLDELLKRRRELLSKGTFTEEDREALRDIEAEIGSLPAGESLEEARAIETILSAAERIKHEEPLLINPAEEDPGDHVGFRRAYIYAIDDNRKGRVTIDILKLNRSDLAESRLNVYKRMQAIAELEGGRALLQDFTRSDAQYAAMARAAVAADFDV